MSKNGYFFFLRSLAFALIALFVFAEQASAELVSALPTATPTSLVITLKRLELCPDIDCSSPAVLGTETKQFDVAGVSAGTDVDNYVESASIPRGITYPYIRARISRTFSISGAATVPNVNANLVSACYTTSSGTQAKTDGGSASANLSYAQSNASAQTIELVDTGDLGGNLVKEVTDGDDFISTMRLPSSLLINPTTAAPEIILSINVADALSFDVQEGSCVADFEELQINVSTN